MFVHACNGLSNRNFSAVGKLLLISFPRRLLMSPLSTCFHLIIYLNSTITFNYFNKIYFNFLPPLLLPGHKMVTRYQLLFLLMALISPLIFPGNSSFKALNQSGISTHLDLSATATGIVQAGRGWGGAPPSHPCKNINDSFTSETIGEVMKCYRFPGIPLHLCQEVTYGRLSSFKHRALSVVLCGQRNVRCKCNPFLFLL